jgi:DNA-binding LytR/AlgR family response regulator
MSNLTIHCIVTDDEPMARKGLTGYIEKIGFLKLVTVCEDAIQLNNYVQQHPVDLLFLDIEMPYITGIDFLKQVKQPPKVIFTTAYEHYALQGYELDVLDYLLKPISFERFLKAANKAYDYFRSRQDDTPDYFFAKTDTRLEKIQFDEMLFAEAMENYVAIYTTDKKIITHSTLKAVAEKLPAYFIQPHKSYLVNMNYIEAVEGNLLHLKKFQVPISKYQKEEVLSRIVNNKLLKK